MTSDFNLDTAAPGHSRPTPLFYLSFKTKGSLFLQSRILPGSLHVFNANKDKH